MEDNPQDFVYALRSGYEAVISADLSCLSSCQRSGPVLSSTGASDLARQST